MVYANYGDLGGGLVVPTVHPSAPVLHHSRAKLIASRDSAAQDHQIPLPWSNSFATHLWAVMELTGFRYHHRTMIDYLFINIYIYICIYIYMNVNT